MFYDAAEAHLGVAGDGDGWFGYADGYGFRPYDLLSPEEFEAASAAAAQLRAMDAAAAAARQRQHAGRDGPAALAGLRAEASGDAEGDEDGDEAAGEEPWHWRHGGQRAGLHDQRVGVG